MAIIWLDFLVICALLFLASSIRNHDTLAFFGSLIFLLTCFVSTVPLFKSFDEKRSDDIQLSLTQDGQVSWIDGT